jgi:hypothetical protein
MLNITSPWSYDYFQMQDDLIFNNSGVSNELIERFKYYHSTSKKANACFNSLEVNNFEINLLFLKF